MSIVSYNEEEKKKVFTWAQKYKDKTPEVSPEKHVAVVLNAEQSREFVKLVKDDLWTLKDRILKQMFGEKG